MHFSDDKHYKIQIFDILFSNLRKYIFQLRWKEWFMKLKYKIWGLWGKAAFSWPSYLHEIPILTFYLANRENIFQLWWKEWFMKLKYKIWGLWGKAAFSWPSYLHEIPILTFYLANRENIFSVVMERMIYETEIQNLRPLRQSCTFLTINTIKYEFLTFHQQIAKTIFWFTHSIMRNIKYTFCACCIRFSWK
jgi:hypothetical protein